MPTTRTTDPTWDGRTGSAALSECGVLALALFPLAIPILVRRPPSWHRSPSRRSTRWSSAIANVVFTIRRHLGGLSRFNRDRRREHQPQPAR
jgi:hypothetical protein